MRRHRKPSDLAAVAARSAAIGTSTVRFDVAHFLPAGAGADLPDGGDDELVASHRVGEALAVEAAGVGMRVRTWTPRLPEEPPDDVAVTSLRSVAGPLGSALIADLPSVESRAGAAEPTAHEYAGHSVVNPSFLYDRTQTLEVLLTVDADGWQPDLGDCRMIGLIAEEVTAVATAWSRPVLLLQSPVAPYHDAPPSYRKDGSGEAPRRAEGLVVRAAIGIDEGRPGERLAMLSRLGSFAKDRGLGLQCSDTRLGRVVGEWWTVFPPRPRIYRREKARQAAVAEPGVHPSEVRVVTIVGPARVGSAAAILGELSARRVGVLAVTISALQEIAVVHVVVPVAPARVGRGTATVRIDDDLGRGLGRLASDCGLTPRRGLAERRSTDISAAADHVVLESGPVVRPPSRGDAVGDHPVWVSWSLPAAGEQAADAVDVDPLSIVVELTEKATDVAAARLLYARVRRAPTGRWHGRAKLAVTLDGAFDPEAVPAILGAVCAEVASAARTRCGQLGLGIGDVEVRVAWRERWLAAR